MAEVGIDITGNTPRKLDWDEILPAGG